MPFKKGQPRPKNAGRKRGTDNKSSASLKLRDQLGATGLCIAEEMKRLLDDPSSTPKERFTMIQWLTEWTQTKPKESAFDDLGDFDDLDLDEAENNVVSFGSRK